MFQRLIQTSGNINFFTLDYHSALKVALSQKVQDRFFIANFAMINIPFYYPKLLHS